MASIPPKFVYSNAKAYFDGTLDPETAKRWERTVMRELAYFDKKRRKSWLSGR